MILTYIDNFIKRVNEEKLPIEAIVLANKDSILKEHRFTWVDTRNIYSHTKSVSSIIIGIAVKENIVSTEDYLIDVLKDELPENFDKNISKIQLKHLLMMSSGFDEDFLMGSVNGVPYAEPDYLKFMLSQKLKKEPGSAFKYSNGDTYLAVRMLEKKLGYPVQLYYYEKLFKPLNMGNPVIQTDLQGRVFGASGLHLSILNQIKLGQYLLGNHEIDEKYFLEMKSPLISSGGRDSYGYQFWIRNSTRDWYMMCGAFGQHTYILTDLGLVISTQCPDNQEPVRLFEVFDEEILSKL